MSNYVRRKMMHGIEKPIQQKGANFQRVDVTDLEEKMCEYIQGHNILEGMKELRNKDEEEKSNKNVFI